MQRVVSEQSGNQAGDRIHETATATALHNKITCICLSAAKAFSSPFAGHMLWVYHHNHSQHNQTSQSERANIWPLPLLTPGRRGHAGSYGPRACIELEGVCPAIVCRGALTLVHTHTCVCTITHSMCNLHVHIIACTAQVRLLTVNCSCLLAEATG